ncbi:MAG: hypothetical protein N3A65_00320 [candidate division WOR-3 bacterium]|nr:hypothetical protein [candidate division WOR-3 bacterium]
MNLRRIKNIKYYIKKLENREERVETFVQLAKTGSSEVIKPLIETLNKMSLREALSVAEYFANFG